VDELKLRPVISLAYPTQLATVKELLGHLDELKVTPNSYSSERNSLNADQNECLRKILEAKNPDDKVRSANESSVDFIHFVEPGINYQDDAEKLFFGDQKGEK